MSISKFKATTDDAAFSRALMPGWSVGSSISHHHMQVRRRVSLKRVGGREK